MNMNELRKLGGLPIVKDTKQLNEANLSNVKNDKLQDAYGVATFGEVYKMIDPKLAKTITGFIITDNKKMPINLITKDNTLVSMMMYKGKLMPMTSTTIFNIKDMK